MSNRQTLEQLIRNLNIDLSWGICGHGPVYSTCQHALRSWICSYLGVQKSIYGNRP